MPEVVELLGDGIAAELRDAVHALNEALGSPISFRPIDWSLETRESRSAVIDEALAAIRELGAAMKYPTVTKTVSPNQLLRERLDLSVIHRPCRSYPGVSKNYAGTID
ncbi:MAG: isocitrate dehydrogenase, partial [Chloroflexota bacterium]|nr:isocitrate dehydrogenase [Dehalococcoidia bacterium]MDW8047823.1 isocitrate dehydrogenase [Chloroflexota bacterium]